MAKLIFLLDGNVINEYALDKERITIGRRASNDVHIDNLAISGEHAAILIDGEETYIEDMDSTNGTLLNNQPIKKQLLRHGDEIGLGKCILRYLKDATVNHIQPAGFEDTVLVEPKKTMPEQSAVPEGSSSTSQDAGPANTETALAELETASNVNEASEAVTKEEEESVASQQEEDTLNPRLQILNGENAGNVLSLDKSMVKIGKPGEQVAVVTKRQEGYFITHVTGENRPLVNGEEIGARAYALSSHDVVDVMDIKMEFRLD